MPKNSIATFRKRLFALRVAAIPALLLAGFSVQGLRAEDLVENLRKLTRQVGHEYLEPAASGLGTAMNTGWFHRPPTPTKFDLTFDFGFVVVGGLYVGAPRHFETDAQFNFDREPRARPWSMPPSPPSTRIRATSCSRSPSAPPCATPCWGASSAPTST